MTPEKVERLCTVLKEYLEHNQEVGDEVTGELSVQLHQGGVTNVKILSLLRRRRKEHTTQG